MHLNNKLTGCKSKGILIASSKIAISGCSSQRGSTQVAPALQDVVPGPRAPRAAAGAGPGWVQPLGAGVGAWCGDPQGSAPRPAPGLPEPPEVGRGPAATTSWGCPLTPALPQPGPSVLHTVGLLGGEGSWGAGLSPRPWPALRPQSAAGMSSGGRCPRRRAPSPWGCSQPAW